MYLRNARLRLPARDGRSSGRVLRFRCFAGLTVVELVVALSIVAILVGLLLPAVQSAREAARLMSCQSRLREFTFASKQCSDAMNALPESRIGIDSNTGQGTFERMWGRMIAPFLIGNVANEWSSTQRPFESAYSGLFGTAPAILQCPSSIIKQKVEDFSTLVGHPIETGISTETSDYRGNLGFFDMSFPHRGFGGMGPFAILKEKSEPIKEASITDGLSNTIYAWETVGAGLVEQVKRGEELVISRWLRSNSPQFFYFENSDKAEDQFESPEGSSLHGHFKGWPGFAAGHIYVYWIINDEQRRYSPRYLQSNYMSDPFSLHPAGINVSMCDGSIRRIRWDMEWDLLYALIQKNEASKTIAPGE